MKRAGFSSILRIASHDLAARKPRTRKCATCRTPFAPRNMAHKVCSPECGLALAEKLRTTADRAETRKRLATLKTRAAHLKDAQAAVNAWVRARDAVLPCISCGRMHQGQWHAGHFLSVGAHPALRFCTLNIAKQCQPCNVKLSGNALAFRRGLIDRLGPVVVEWLEGPHDPVKYTIPEIQAIRAEYKQKLREIQ